MEAEGWVKARELFRARSHSSYYTKIIVDPDFTSETALVRAFVAGWTYLAQMLLQQKDIDVNAQAPAGTTALHAAVRGRNIALTELMLLRQDVDLNIDNGLGNIARQSATLLGYDEVVDVLAPKVPARNYVKRGAVVVQRWWTAAGYMRIRGRP